MNRVTKQVLKGWFDAYKSLTTELKIENYNTYVTLGLERTRLTEVSCVRFNLTEEAGDHTQRLQVTRY